MNHLYKRYYKHQWKAIAFLWAAFTRTFCKAVTDIVVKHWLITIAIIAAFVVMFITMGKARAERDRGEIINYNLQCQIDSIMNLRK